MVPTFCASLCGIWSHTRRLRNCLLDFVLGATTTSGSKGRRRPTHFAAYPSNFGRAVVRAVEKIMINDVFMQVGDKDGPDVEFVEAEQPER